MNILLVIPFHDDLPLLPAEARSLSALLNPRRVLSETATEDRLSQVIDEEVAKDGPFDGIWIATHSSGEAVQLTDGTLPRHRLVQYIAMSGAHWVVLNGCEGEGLANSINTLGVDVVATAATIGKTGVEDRDALVIAKRLAQGLRDCDGDLKLAFDSLGDHSDQYRFYAAISSSRALSDNNELVRMIIDQTAKIASVQQQQEHIQQQQDEILRRLTALENKTAPRATATFTTIMSTAAVTLFVMAVLYLLYINVRG